MAERPRIICDECPAHDVEMDRRLRLRQDVDKLEAKVASLRDKAIDDHQAIALIQRDLCVIDKNIRGVKKPLWILGAAVLIQLVQMFFDLLPRGAI